MWLGGTSVLVAHLVVKFASLKERCNGTIKIPPFIESLPAAAWHMLVKET